VNETTTQETDDVPKVKDIPDRITVVELVYHQVNGEEDATCSEARFSRQLETSGEYPYVRHTKATEEWQHLDLGWIADVGCSMLTIENNEGYFKQRLPTEDEKTEVDKKAIELGYSPYASPILSCFLIPPKESFRCCPSNAKDLMIRCQSGEAKYTLTVFPV